MKGVEGEDADVFEVLNPGVGILVEQPGQDPLGLLAVSAEDVPRSDLLDALPAGEWRTVKGDVADQVERIEGLPECLAHFISQRFEEHALGFESFDDGLLPALLQRCRKSSSEANSLCTSGRV